MFTPTRLLKTEDSIWGVPEDVSDTSLHPYIVTKGRTKYIAPDGEKLIISAFTRGYTQVKSATVADNRQPENIDAVYTMIGMLKEELEAKNTQLAKKDEQIERLTTALENTTASLHAAQALHAGTMHKQLGEGDGDRPEGAAPQQEAVEVMDIEKIRAEPPAAAPADPEHKPGFFARIFRRK